MWDLFTSAIFIACQCALLGLVLRPLIGSKLDGHSPRARTTRLCCYGLGIAIIIVSAASSILPSIIAPASPQSLTAQVLAGAPISIHLEPEACLVFDLGTIQCETRYDGQYEIRSNRWIVTGPSGPSREIITSESNNAERIPGTLSLWGVLLRFDADGALYRYDQKIGQLDIASAGPPELVAVGSLRRGPTMMDRVFDGEPLTLVFDAETCVRHDLGNLECGVEYEVRYDRKANRWTVVGPGKISRGLVTASADNAEPRRGSLSIWGMINSFDDSGDLKFLGKKVGRVRLGSRAEPSAGANGAEPPEGRKPSITVPSTASR
jgi:hypothetical protein